MLHMGADQEYVENMGLNRIPFRLFQFLQFRGKEFVRNFLILFGRDYRFFKF